MKRIFLILLFLLFVFSVKPVNSQGQVIFLPVISKGDCMLDCSENSWKLIVPLESTNKVLNPSAEKTGNYVALGTASITRSTTYQHYGLYSYHVQTFADDDGINLTLSQLSNSAHFLTFRVRGILPPNFRAIIGTGLKTPQLIHSINTYWSLYGVAFSPSECNGQTSLHLIQQGRGSGDFYLDGIQVEAQTEWTTYIDGDQPGCSWNGTSHAASSTRSGESKAGGTVEDFYDTYGFFLKNVTGMGMTSRTLNIDEYALLPGGELNSIKIDFRNFAIIGEFRGQTEKILHNNIQNFINAISPGYYYGNQPVIIRFSGSVVQKEISAYPKVGPEGEVNVYYGNLELVDSDKWGEIKEWVITVGIQFTATDPYWYEVGESAILLDTYDSRTLYDETTTFRLVAGRLKSNGQWSNLGPPAAPGTAVYTLVRAIAEDGTYIYFGGDFQNFNNIANADYIVRYHKITGVYSAMGTGLNDYPTRIKIGPDNNIYVVGRFTTAGGAAANRIAVWNPVSETWSTLGTGFNGRAWDIEFGDKIYVGGEFSTAGGNPAERIAQWNGSVWSALGAGFGNGIFTIALSPDKSTLYVGGTFVIAGGDIADRIAKWDIATSTWSAVSSGIGTTGPLAMVFDAVGNLYVAGNFTTAGGVSVNNITMWNGTAFQALGSGVNSTVNSLSIGTDGILYIGGQFTQAGGIALSDKITKWNGYSYSHMDIDLPGVANVYAIFPSKYVDAVIPHKYDIYLGFDTTGIGSIAGLATANNEGNVSTYPMITFERIGGQSATIASLINERTGKKLLFNYGLLNGESLIINLKPTIKSIKSSFDPNYRFDAILANSDFGDWNLLPGNNDVTSFVNSTGNPTVTAYMLWRDTYESFD